MSFLVEIPLNTEPFNLQQFFHSTTMRFGGHAVQGSKVWIGGIIRPFYMKSEKDTLLLLLKEFEDGNFNFCSDSDYAIASCNWELGTIVLARDYSGTCGIYYTQEGSKLIVGSSLFEVLSRKKHRKFCDTACLELLKYEFITDPLTLFEDVYSVPHGHKIVFNLSGKLITSYKPGQLSTIRESLEGDIYSGLRTAITNAHLKRLTQHNGIYLSGGIDSSVSAITLKNDLGIKRVDAFTFSTLNAEQDESCHAKFTAEQLGLNYEHVIVDPNANIDLDVMIDGMSYLYPGMVMMGAIGKRINDLGLTGINLFAGQDTRLHTPHFNLIDRIVLDRFLNNSSMRALLAESGKLLSTIFRNKGRLAKGAHRLSYANKLASYIQEFFFHRHKRSLFIETTFTKKHIDEFICLVHEQVSGLATSRSIFNSIVEMAWNKQYTDDMSYMIGATE